VIVTMPMRPLCLITPETSKHMVRIKKTQCRHGHEFTPENTRYDSDGHRACRACDRERYERVMADPVKKAALLARNEAYRVANPERRRATQQTTRDKHIVKYRIRWRKDAQLRRTQLRQEALAAYGGVCVWCGESRKECLNFDHINDDGKQHREILSSPTELYRWLKENNYPKDVVQLLCGSCHNAKSFYGVVGTPFDPMTCVGGC